MAAGKLAIKARIRSIESTKKITKAMQLVASSKLQKQKKSMEENREYAKYLKETMQDILSSSTQNHPYLKINEGKKLLIVLSSDMGLCGGYNANVYRTLKGYEDHEIIMIGSRGVNYAKAHDLALRKQIVDVDHYGYEVFAKLALELLNAYKQQEIASISVLYTRFINSVTFEPDVIDLLPLRADPNHKVVSADTIYEPDQNQILDFLVPMYIKSMLYSIYLETKTSEQASRRMAMESATDSAEEIQAALQLQFNKARQAAITQEITEIVGGVNALEGESD